MRKVDEFETLQAMIEAMGSDELLVEIYNYFSTDEFVDCLCSIANDYDLDDCIIEFES